MRMAAISLTAAWLCSCTPTMSSSEGHPTTHAEPAVDELHVGAAIAEVEQLHAFFVGWFRGEVPDSDAAFSRFASALAPRFEMVVPSGSLLVRAQVMLGVRGAYGGWKGDDGATIEIRNAKGEIIGEGLVRVSYEEWQRRSGAWRGRRSTALLRHAARRPAPRTLAAIGTDACCS